MKTFRSSLALVSLALSLPSLALANVGVSLEGVNGTQATVSFENGYDFDVKLAGVRLSFDETANGRCYYYSQEGWTADLAAGASTSASLTFTAGAPCAGDEALDDNRGTMVAAGIDTAALAAPVEAAVGSDSFDQIKEQLAFISPRVEPVSRSARFFEELLPASGLDVDTWFNVERMDALKASLETALCENVSGVILSRRGNSAIRSAFDEYSEKLREAGLHINCINDDAQLAAARMMIAGERPQDALLFNGRDEDGNVLEAWRPILIQGNLAMAALASDQQVSGFRTARPSIEALAAVKELDPTNREYTRMVNSLLPRVGASTLELITGISPDLSQAYQALQLLLANWPEREEVQAAANALAVQMTQDGLAKCERREFINSRNVFVRGERILSEIPAWREQADSINRCRALGALEEGREMAAHETDPNGPDNGFEKLAEAQSRFDLPQEEIDAFKTDIANAHARFAGIMLEDYSFGAALHHLERAEELAPNGPTEATLTGWLDYAEARHAQKGFTMTGADVEDARMALEKAGDIDPERTAAIESKLQAAYMGYRVGIPALLVLLGIISGLFMLNQKRKGKQFEAFADDEDDDDEDYSYLNS